MSTRTKAPDWRRKWGGQTVRLGDFLYWHKLMGYSLRAVEQISRAEDRPCIKCSSRHHAKGWNWIQGTACCHVCDGQIKRDIPPKTERDWDAYGR